MHIGKVIVVFEKLIFVFNILSMHKYYMKKKIKIICFLFFFNLERFYWVNKNQSKVEKTALVILDPKLIFFLINRYASLEYLKILL